MTDLLGVRAARGSLWLLGVNVVSKGSQMAVTLVLAAFLTEGDLGTVSLVVSLVNIGQVIQSMGVYDVISRTDRDPRRFAGTVLTLSVSAGLVLAAALVLAADVVAELFGTPGAAPLVRLAAVTLPFSAAGGVLMGLMHRDLDFRRRMLPDAGSAVLGAAVTVVLAAHGDGPRALVIGLLCTAIAQPVLGALAGVRCRPGWDSGAAREALRWIAVVGPAAIVAVLLVTVDYLAIGHVLGADALGVYSLAYRIAWVPYILVAVVLGGVAFPLCAALIRSGRRAELPAVACRFTRATLAVTGGLFVVAAVLADRVVLLGDRWAPAAGVLALLCGYGLAISVLQTWHQVIKAAGHARLYLGLQAAHLVVLVSLLVPGTRFGVTAVALIQVGAAWLLVGGTWWAMVRRGLAFRPAELARMALGVGLAGAVCAAAGMALDGGWTESVAGTLVEGLVLLVVYGGVLLLVDRDIVRQLRGLRAVGR
ncbi:polysaccharide transporter, PST family [Actinokineospora alba]|uniref:Polysaccharide transporter, PST family n=1 Tax=Actinokineospora alba TaxID=504798 RepID=A0A1H0HZJ2_9PSEU|nr:oligosaccharide flippase family protein [Actinokineospora alba]TDP64689.1 PST family polysaccharide transporter [Actinokineospora alba]SDI84001.1 polysaccharide transporter, PST family [Actinokineospora alba]SDO24241.1 polysaccharide transporter, PST family [Actinokineospora alba]